MITFLIKKINSFMQIILTVCVGVLKTIGRADNAAGNFNLAIQLKISVH